MKNYLGNAFSLQMLNLQGETDVKICPVEAKEIPADAISVIGHADTAAVVGSLLGRTVEMNRVSVSLTPEDTLFVAQVVGGRLPEGSVTLPEGFQIKFVKVTVS